LPPDCEARIRYSGWFKESVFKRLIDPELTFYTDKAWFTLCAYINSQNNRHWSTENPDALHEVPLHDLKLGIWCAISVQKVTGPMFFS
jgi:hypothetical protein